MCLYTQQLEPRVAETPIRVYKVLIEIDGEYYPPFHPVIPYRRGMNYAGGNGIIVKEKSGVRQVTKGWLHAYKRPIKLGDTAIHDLRGVKLFRMDVVKGTKYYESLDGNEICAQCLFWEDMDPKAETSEIYGNTLHSVTRVGDQFNAYLLANR